MTADEIMSEIMKSKKVHEIYQILSEYIVAENEQLKHDLLERQACLRAIHKINNGKNETIANLSELEEL